MPLLTVLPWLKHFLYYNKHRLYQYPLGYRRLADIGLPYIAQLLSILPIQTTQPPVQTPRVEKLAAPVGFYLTKGLAKTPHNSFVVTAKPAVKPVTKNPFENLMRPVVTIAITAKSLDLAIALLRRCFAA